MSSFDDTLHHRVWRPMRCQTSYGTSNADGTPADPDRMAWADADDENAARARMEERAYCLMDAHDKQWTDWLMDPKLGPDGGDVARLLSLYLLGDTQTATDKLEIMGAACNVRSAFVDYLESLT